MKTKYLLQLLIVVLLPMLVNAEFVFQFISDIIQGFFDLLCLLPLIRRFCNDCNPNPCLNGGECTDKISAFECSCTTGHTGDTCEECVAGFEKNDTTGACVDIDEVSELFLMASDAKHTHNEGGLADWPSRIFSHKQWLLLLPAVLNRGTLFRSRQLHQRRR